MPSSYFTKKTLTSLYSTQKLSSYKIAKHFDCDPKTVFYWLKQFNIPTRPRKIVHINKKQLSSLYASHLSMATIGNKFFINASAVLRKMKKYNISSRKPWETNTKHPRNNFSKNLLEKAYLLGFRIGDLNVRSNSSSVIVKSNTTHRVQINLMKSLFSKYGPIWISSPKSNARVYHCTIGLNHSFDFLVPKPSYIPKWIILSKSCFWHFFAGYIDAEGTIRIYSNRARLRVGSYDKSILKQIHTWLTQRGIKNSFRLETPADHIQHNGDFYRVDLMDRHALSTVLKKLNPLLKHERRKKDAQLALTNVISRI